MSKGSRNRVKDIKRYNDNYKKIFNKDLPENITVERAKELNIILDDEQKLSRVRSEKKIAVKKEYTDRNGIDMVVVNINDAMTNTIMTARELKALQHECVNEEYQPTSGDSDVIEVEAD